MNFILSLVMELLLMFLLIYTTVLHDSYKFNYRGGLTYGILLISIFINTFILANLI